MEMLVSDCLDKIDNEITKELTEEKRQKIIDDYYSGRTSDMSFL